MVIRFLDNRRSQAIFVFMMLAIVIFIMAMAFVKPLQESIGYAGNTSISLNCTDVDISAANKATCVVLDMSLFYFLSVVIAIGIALVAGKRTLTGILTSIVVFVVVVIIITPLKDFIIIFRDASHLNCAASTITVGARMLCIFVDLWLFYFIMTCIAAGMTYVFAKKVLVK